MSEKQAILQIEKIYKSLNREWVNEIVLIKDNRLLKIFKRK